MASPGKAAILALALAGAPARTVALAEGVSFGAGVASIGVRSVQLERGHQGGTGFRLWFGYRLWDRLVLELATSSPGNLDTLPTVDIS